MAEPVSRTYQVGFAVAQLTGLFGDDLGEALSESWRAGTTVTRYGRRWQMARPHETTTDYMVGRIGFVSEASVTTMFFDHEAGDFVTEATSAGVLVPFAVRLSDGVVAYQLRPGLVRENSFTGALEALLNAGDHLYLWSIRSAVQTLDWDSWRSRIDRVTNFNFRVERPNPHYADDHLIEELVESVVVEYLRLSGEAIEGESIDTDSDLFRQALNHVLREYGRAAVHGVGPNEEESTWVKVKGMPGSVTARGKLQGFGDPEIPEADLVGVLLESSSVEASADLHGLVGDDHDQT